MLSSRRAAVPPSTGAGLTSAVEGAMDADDWLLAAPKKSGNEGGKGPRFVAAAVVVVVVVGRVEEGEELDRCLRGGDARKTMPAAPLRSGGCPGAAGCVRGEEGSEVAVGVKGLYSLGEGEGDDGGPQSRPATTLTMRASGATLRSGGPRA